MQKGRDDFPQLHKQGGLFLAWIETALTAPYLLSLILYLLALQDCGVDF
jgi:hypothetical protein